VSALRVLPGGAEGGCAPWMGRLVSLDLADAIDATAGSYDGDVAGFIGRGLGVVTEIVPLAASASALRRARLHALSGGGEVTGGRAVLRVAG
jgi:hypothetical protein